MSAEWKKLKTEINDQIENLKSKLGTDFNANPKKTLTLVLVKIKDNAKEAVVTIAPKDNPEVKSELSINLQNTQNLAKRFESLLSDYKAKNK
ncbi:MAG: hypothetical protein H7256_09500 [Bdellovibrio sp.]|nr:hypothetical protein [Bdellovibrio sp.]